MKLRVGGILQSSLVNGKGARYVIFVSGCPHKCKGCHNDFMQDVTYGRDMNIYEIVMDIVKYKNAGLIDGVTLSGGDPFSQFERVEDLIYELIQNGITDIWVYSGYTYEQAKDISPYILENASVLVDGKFDDLVIDNNIKYRGSKNQRIIDLQLTKQKQEIVIISDNTLD